MLKTLFFSISLYMISWGFHFRIFEIIQWDMNISQRLGFQKWKNRWENWSRKFRKSQNETTCWPVYFHKCTHCHKSACNWNQKLVRRKHVYLFFCILLCWNLKGLLHKKIIFRDKNTIFWVLGPFSPLSNLF